MGRLGRQVGFCRKPAIPGPLPYGHGLLLGDEGELGASVPAETSPATEGWPPPVNANSHCIFGSGIGGVQGGDVNLIAILAESKSIIWSRIRSSSRAGKLFPGLTGLIINLMRSNPRAI